MVKSPCKRKCFYDEELKFCLGCFRTVQEITNWSLLDDSIKLGILKQLKERRVDNKNELLKKEKKMIDM